MKRKFYMMRHGETLFNKREKIQGWCDSPLTEKGIHQAEAARKYLDDIKFTHLYSSTSERACDTLEIATRKRMPYKRLKGLREMNFGTFEGESEDLNPPHDIFETFFINYGGETRNMVKERLNETALEIMSHEDHDVVLAVSHAGACLHFMRNWVSESRISEELKLGFSNCMIIEYEFDRVNQSFELVEVIRPGVE